MMDFPARVDSGPVVGRLAPTPSGLLHLGNACAFAAAWLSVRAKGGELLLRVEDVDTTRARRAVEDQLREDMAWLGLTWDREVPRQSERDYGPALEALGEAVYFCECTRAQIRANGGVHPNELCKARQSHQGAVRWSVPEAGQVAFEDRRWGRRVVTPGEFGDPVLRRRDGIFAYTLAVVADDIADGVTEVVRGADLLDFSALQSLLWRALGHEPPSWLHAPLLLGGDGRKLSKSHGSLHIGAMREASWSPRDIWRLLLPMLGIDGAETLPEAVSAFKADGGALGPIGMDLPVDAACPASSEGVAWSEVQ